jgi:hypothetical protein
LIPFRRDHYLILLLLIMVCLHLVEHITFVCG